jgi:hypothetical protein
MSAAPPPAKGQFTYTAADGSKTTVPIDFNPAALDYSISINAQGEGGQTQQAAGAASAKLNLELTFDTTDSGDDVRGKTNKVELMLRPPERTGGPEGPPQAPPMVTFEWGAFSFTGIVDSFKQTMDFFSASGVPLRAVVALSMSQPNYQFDQAGGESGGAGNDALVVPGGNPSQLATDAGNPFAARVIASANGLESLRASAGVSLSIGGGVTIGAAASFSAGASVGGGAGAGIGINLGIGGGVGSRGGAGFSASFGSGSSAGISASSGAFNGLHASSSAGATAGSALAPQRLFTAASAPAVAPGGQFDVTGKAIAQSASTFKADVGGARRLRFDET